MGQLDGEMDEIFNTVSFTLEDAKMLIGGMQYHKDDAATIPIHDESRIGLHKQCRAPYAREPSTSNPRHKNDAKNKERLTIDPSPRVPNMSSSSKKRQTFTDMAHGIAGIFAGKIFNRIETARNSPSRMGSTGADLHLSSEPGFGDSTEGSRTPTEPFHLEDLTSRLSAASVFPVARSAIVSRSSTPTSLTLDREVHELSDMSVERSTPTHSPIFSLPIQTLPSPTPLRDKCVVSSQAPVIAGQRLCQCATSHLTPKLPLKSLCQCPVDRGTWVARDLEGGLILESAPYPLIGCDFRHHSIRLSRHPNFNQNTNLKTRKSEAAPLDWTAFQMAISGGIGDYLMGSDSITADSSLLEELDREADDILEWWSELGINAGGMIYHEQGVESKGNQKIGIINDNIDKGRELELSSIELLAELDATVPSHSDIATRDKLTKRKGKADSLRLDLKANETKLASNGGHPKTDSDGFENDKSLPPSPMEELSPDALIGQGVMVPMGFNLDHDLKDYLKWETECVEGILGRH
jgi:hypothetical protein